MNFNYKSNFSWTYDLSSTWCSSGERVKRMWRGGIVCRWVSDFSRKFFGKVSFRAFKTTQFLFHLSPKNETGNLELKLNMGSVLSSSLVLSRPEQNQTGNADP